MSKYALLSRMAAKRELGEVASEVLSCFSDYFTENAGLLLKDERLEKPKYFVRRGKDTQLVTDIPYEILQCDPNMNQTWVDESTVYLANANGMMGCIFNLQVASEKMEEVAFFAEVAASAIDNALEHYVKDRQIANLNTYLTISNTLHFSIELKDQLACIINLCVDAVQAEAASVLLLNDEKNMLEFYAVEGEKSEALSKFTLPVEHGIAGWVIRENESIVVNDVRSDGRFFQGVDNDPGFVTNSILAVPMIAGEEKVGVVEVVNKLDGEFTKDDLNLLTDIAEEAAFAVKNAKMFEYVANTYCKIRSGAGSCRGCNRPLKTWTPCQRDRIIE